MLYLFTSRLFVSNKHLQIITLTLVHANRINVQVNKLDCCSLLLGNTTNNYINDITSSFHCSPVELIFGTACLYICLGASV